MVLACFVCFTMVLSSIYSDETQVRPENKVLKLGQQYVWPCQIPRNPEKDSIPIQWSSESRGTDPIYTGSKVPDSLNHKFQVIEQNTSDFKKRDLKFLDVSLEESDIYRCTQGLIKGFGYSANIIVAEPDSTKCDVFPKKTNEEGFVMVKKHDSFKITCHVTYHTRSNCYAVGLWKGTQNDSLENHETMFNNRSFSTVLKIDENFKNGSSYQFLLRFKCQKSQQIQGEYSTKEPIFDTGFATPNFYLAAAEIPKPVESTISSSTTNFVTPHLGASEQNPSERALNHHNSQSTIIFVFAGILSFFAILVIVLVSLFLVKYHKRTSDDSLTMYTRGQSMMTENVAYRRQPVSCENSYNMQVNNSLTPPPQTASKGFQGVLSPHAPHSAVPLLNQGLQQFHHGASLIREASVDESEVYDRIDDKGIAPSIYIGSIKKQPFSTMAPSSSSHQLPHYTPSVVGYIPMTPSRMPSGHLVQSIPSSPAYFSNDPGLYLVPQDKQNESQ